MSSGRAPRWPLVGAAIFCIYALVLLWNVFQSNAQLREAADARLVADSSRRATTLAEFAAHRRAGAEELAALHELRTYLINKALGMSPLYGLDASLAAVEQRFGAWVGSGKPGDEQTLARVAFLDAAGQPLADTGSRAAALPGPAAAAAASSTTLTLDLERRTLVATAPVVFKGEPSGWVVTVGDLGQLYHSLIQLRSHGSYRETLLTTDGREIAPPGRPGVFSTALAAELARLPTDRPTELSTLAASTGPGGLRDSVAIVAPVPGLPIVLVTSQSRGELYGHLSSSWFLVSLCVFPVLVLFAALHTDRLQQRARRLELDALRSDSQRQALQGRNEALAGEIVRREAVEAELQRHREHLEELVEQRSAELNRLFHALPDLYFRTTRDGTVLEHRAGRDAELLLAPERFVGRKLQEVLPADVARQINAALAALARGVEQSVIEYGLELPRGRQHFEARMLPLGDEQCVTVVRNVTERHEIEEVREANRREAENLVRVKSEFLANMSHEIRTPLNAVLGLAQIGARDRAGAGAGAGAIFRRIEEAGRHLLGIIDDILDLSKLEAGKLSVERRAFRLAAAVEAAVSLVSGRTAAKGLALRVEVAPELPAWVEGDSLRLKQVLVNLLGNAIKFTEQGEVSLEVSAHAGQVTFRVADTGIGMNAAQLKRLFRPFEQADGSTTRRFGGTGLGLAISRNLAGLMGGDLTADSRPGAGSTFTLSLALPAAAAPAEARAGNGRAGARLTGLRVLAAEDVEVNRLVLESQLRHEGAHVVFAHDGQDAVARVAQAGPNGYDAVLMDVQMPVMDGLEATRQIRQLAPDLPVIGLTAHALADERDRCLAAGMVERVVKPVDLDQLVAALLRHIARPADSVLGGLDPLPRGPAGGSGR